MNKNLRIEIFEKIFLEKNYYTCITRYTSHIYKLSILKLEFLDRMNLTLHFYF